MRVDAHQHFWSYDPLKHQWISDGMDVLKKDFVPKDLFAHLQANGIDGTVAVQADETEAETGYLLELAAKHDFIKSVVGWTDLRTEDAEENIIRHKQSSKLAGFRCIMQGAEDTDYLKNNVFTENIKLLHRYDLSYDLLVYQNQMESLVRFVDKLPDNRLILDHIGKPDIKNKEIKLWKQHLKELAAHPGVYCKLSGMITEADHSSWTYEELIPYLETAAEYFGVDRICFGSDWPVCLLAGTYDTVVGVMNRFAGQLSPQEREKLFGLNTLNFYKL